MKEEKIYLIGYAKELAVCKSMKKRASGLWALVGHLECYCPNDLPLDEVDRVFLLAFISYLHETKQTHVKKEKLLHQNTCVHYFRLLRYVFNNAVADGHLSCNPLLQLRPHELPQRVFSERCYLTMEELRQLVHTPIYNKVLKRAFLFSCFCGLRHVDVAALKWSNLQVGYDGTLFLSITQQKTGRPLNIPLSASAIQQLPERPTTPQAKDEKVFAGLITLGRSNEVLYRWAEQAGVHKHITFHTARHSFATMLITLGADIYTVSKLLGHAHVKTTEIYLRLTDEKKKETIGLIPSFE